jgi:acetyl-CoA acyltransferase
VYLSTGLVAENHARESSISREAQDQFAFRSHQRAIAAIEAGRFKDEIVPLTVRVAQVNGGNPSIREFTFDTDEGPRRDTSVEALAKLRPAFHVAGTVTAGNSSQTSDGAAAVIVTSAKLAKERGLTPMARFVGYATAGVKPELFGIGPVPAIRKALKQTGLTLDQIDLIELNEAFAAQALACMKELDLDPEKVNVSGGAIALGHPLGCTGGKLTATIVHEMRRRKARYGMVTMCVGGGMGAAGIFELM